MAIFSVAYAGPKDGQEEQAETECRKLLFELGDVHLTSLSGLQVYNLNFASFAFPIRRQPSATGMVR